MNNEYTGKRVKIGIVDTGISVENYSLISSSIACGRNFSLDGTPRDYFKAECNHGFAVASIILSVAPKAKLVIAKVLNDRGEGDPRKTAEGIRYCISKKCHIINCSIAGPHDPDLEEAVNEARDRGIIVVGAMGNDGQEKILYPASYMSCLGVGAGTSHNELADFSNYNFFMDLVALGEEIKIKTKDGYFIDSGTSFSAPLVSGTLAILREQYKEETGKYPSFGELRQLLFKKCIYFKNIDRLKQGNGYLNYEGGIK